MGGVDFFVLLTSTIVDASPQPPHETRRRQSCSATMASPHSLRTVVVDGEYFAPKGQIIKLRLGPGLEGSLDSATSPSMSVVSTAASPPHSALVLRSRFVLHEQSQRLEITCFAVASYHREEDPIQRVLEHSNTKEFLPLPSPQHVPTPPEFGKPIRAGDYVSDRPCRVVLRELIVLLDSGKRVISQLHLNHCCRLLMSILVQGVRPPSATR